MLTRRCFIAILTLLPVSSTLRADQDQARTAKLTTVTLLIDGMT